MIATHRLPTWALAGLVGGVLCLAPAVGRAQQPPPKGAPPKAAPAAVKPAAPAPLPAPEAFDAAVKLYDNNQCTEALGAFTTFTNTYRFSTLTPMAVYYNGWCLFCLERYQDAAKAFEGFINIYKGNSLAPEALLKVAECYKELKEYPKAAEVYRKFQTQYSKPPHELLPQAVLGEAVMYYRQALAERDKDAAASKKDFTTGKQIARSAISRFEGDMQVKLDALNLLAQILTDEKNFAEAQAIYREMSSQSNNPQANRAMFMLAETMYNAGRYAEAIPYYQRVLPKPILLQRIREAIEQLTRQTATVVRTGGSPALIRARIAALRSLSDQIQAEPDMRASALFRLANCYDQLGRPDEALVVYRHFRRIFTADKLTDREKPLAEQAWYKLTEMLNKAGRLKEAEAELKKFNEEHQGSNLAVAAALLDADTKFRTEQYQPALDAYQNALKDTKDANVQEWADFQIGACYFGLKQYPKAIEITDAFLKKYPKSKNTPLALFRVGRSHFEIAQLAQAANDTEKTKTELAEAIRYYEQIRTQFADNEIIPEITFQLGYLYSYHGAFEKSDYEKAVAAFSGFVTRWPTNPLVPEAIYQTAMNQRALEKFDDAAASLQKLVDQFPNHELAPFAAFEIGTTWAAANKADNMIAAFRAYAQKFPQHARVGEALYAIGSVLESEKKYDEALAALRELVAKTSAEASPSEALMKPTLAAELKIAGILEQQGKVADAVADCKKFLGRFSNDITVAREMISRIASLYGKAKMYPQAMEELDGLTRQYLQNATVRVIATSSATDLALEQKDYKRAYGYALQLLADPEKDHLPAPSYLAIGNALLKTTHADQALEVFQKLLALYPNDEKVVPLAKYGLGTAQLALKNYDAAESALRQMLAAADPKAQPPPDPAVIKMVPEAKEALAETIEAKGQDGDALILYNEIIKIGKGDVAAKASFRAGLFYTKKKETDPKAALDNQKAALAYFMRVALLTGGEIGEESSYRSCECQQALGNVEAARGCYSGYLRRYKDGRFRPQAEDRLKSLPAPPPLPGR